MLIFAHTQRPQSFRNVRCCLAEKLYKLLKESSPLKRYLSLKKIKKKKTLTEGSSKHICSVILCQTRNLYGLRPITLIQAIENPNVTYVDCKWMLLLHVYVFFLIWSTTSKDSDKHTNNNFRKSSFLGFVQIIFFLSLFLFECKRCFHSYFSYSTTFICIPIKVIIK